jgi:DNA-binding transcriptional regulator/RsmH inhibitor MraZ
MEYIHSWSKATLSESLLEIITRDVSHSDLAIYIIKKYLKAKEELWKLKYFTILRHNFQKILLKKPKSFKTFITL